MAAGKKHSSGLAQDLSRGEEAIFGGPSASERSLLVDLANTRGLNATTQNLGGYLVGAELSDIQKSLRPFSSLLAAGAQTDQRQGNLAVPKEVTAPVAQFLHESDTCTESTQFFGPATATPHRASMLLKRTFQIDRQKPDLGDFIIDSARRGFGVAIDKYGLQGSGIAGEPTGIFNTSGVQTVTFSASATWANALSFVSKSAQQNATDENLRFIAAPQVREKWANIQRWSGASTALWSDDDTVAGKHSFVTTNCPSTSIVCGDFSLCWLVFWGPAEFTVDPYTSKRTETLEISATQLADIIFTYPAAFTINSGSATQ